MKIYTRTGDKGETGLVDGSRVGKDHLRVAAYGEVDELSAVLGVARTQAAHATAVGDLLHLIQKDLFALGAQLADPQARVGGRKPKAAFGEDRVRTLETAIDGHGASLPPLQAFVLPGGSTLGAQLHVARTVCRRAERTAVALSRREALEPLLLVYLNRLSDLLFVLAREENLRAGHPEERW